MRHLVLLSLAGAIITLGACSGEKVVAPRDEGVCYMVAPQPDGTVEFNVVARDQPRLEECAGELEKMRRNFLRMGGGITELDGAYQGNFLFLRREGIFTSSTATGPRYLLLVRYGDSLVVPGAIPQPAR